MEGMTCVSLKEELPFISAFLILDDIVSYDKRLSPELIQ